MTREDWLTQHCVQMDDNLRPYNSHTLQLNVSDKKGAVVSNHLGSWRFFGERCVAEATAFMADYAHAYKAATIIANVTIHSTYPRASELRTWMEANPVKSVVSTFSDDKPRTINIHWQLH